MLCRQKIGNVCKRDELKKFDEDGEKDEDNHDGNKEDDEDDVNDEDDDNSYDLCGKMIIWVSAGPPVLGQWGVVLVFFGPH